MRETKLGAAFFLQIQRLDQLVDVLSNASTDFKDNVASSNAHVKLLLDDLKESLVVDTDRLTLRDIVDEELFQVSVDKT